MAQPSDDQEELDGCDIDFTEHTLDEEAEELFPLFAEALDPSSPVTVEDVEREWGVGT